MVHECPNCGAKGRPQAMTTGRSAVGLHCLECGYELLIAEQLVRGITQNRY